MKMIKNIADLTKYMGQKMYTEADLWEAYNLGMKHDLEYRNSQITIQQFCDRHLTVRPRRIILSNFNPSDSINEFSNIPFINLYRLKGFGKKSLQEFKEKLSTFDIHFKY